MKAVSNKLLEIKDLKVAFHEKNKTLKAVEGVDLSIESGEIFGLIGESGAGKSLTGLSIMRLLEGNIDIQASCMKIKDQDLMLLTEEEMRHVRGNKISMIFQDPMTSLNPGMKIGKQIEESLRVHNKVTKKQSEKRVLELMDLLAIPDPEDAVNRYPHEFSGGMRQRVMIAIALACDPMLLIADEPTTALDVTIQAQILQLMKKIVSELNVSILIITHDFGVVSEICKKVSVMYGGQIVEHGPVETILRNPVHPYTKGLLKCVIPLDEDAPNPESIPGSPPRLDEIESGCRFSPRCEFSEKKCRNQTPQLKEIIPGHLARCLSC